MSAIQISTVKDAHFGNCVRMANAEIELLVTIDFGPRVIHFSRIGMENMMYQDLSHNTLGDTFEVFNGDHLKLYGGHRLWIAPEIMPRCYHPDNIPVSWRKVDGGVEFTAAVESLNQIQKSIILSLDPDAPAVRISHTVKNCGTWDIEFALWCLSMMAPGGKEIIPMPDRATGLLANRNISLWDYSDMSDERVHWGRQFITLTQNPDISQPFKLGLNNEAGWAAYFNKGQVLIKSFEPSIDGFYPDNGCCFESYTNHLMIEIETLSEFVSLMPGESATYDEEWELYEAAAAPSDNEDEIKAVMEKYL